MADEYKYSLSQCDMPSERRKTLQMFRDKRKLWLSWIDHDEHHGIGSVVSSMVWSDVSIRTLSQIAMTNENSALNNSLVTEGLVNGYIATQVLAIRRLMDHRGDVISLRRLVKDVQSNIKLFTRENYVCFDGLPYDYEAVGRVVADSRKSDIFWSDSSGPMAFGASQMAHEWFDSLTGISPQNRNRQDCLSASRLKTIESWLDESAAEELANWSHAFLAHAGSLEVRSKFTNAGPTLNKISEAIKILAKATESILSWFLYSSRFKGSLMPAAQFNQFEKMNFPVLMPDLADKAVESWSQLGAERDRWLDDMD